MKNSFETGQRKMIPAVLVYVFCNDEVLMIERNGDLKDIHYGKWNGLGGKLEADESARAAAVRELYEESGIQVIEPEFNHHGVIHFPNFKPKKNEDWLVWVYSTTLDQKPTKLIQTKEGSLHWIKKTELLKLNLWPGDRHFLPRILRKIPLETTIWYDLPELKIQEGSATVKK